MQEASGGSIWRRHHRNRHHAHLGGIWRYLETTWRHLEASQASGRQLGSIWRHLGGIWEASGNIWEASGGTQETPGKHPGGTQGHPEAPRRHPRGTQEVRGFWDAKTTIRHERGMKKVPRPTVSRAQERPDPHQVRSLSAKVSGHRRRADPPKGSLPPKKVRQNPFSVNTVWGIYIYIYRYIMCIYVYIYIFPKQKLQSR